MTVDEIKAILSAHGIADDNLANALTEIVNASIERAGSVDSKKALEIERQISKNQQMRDRGLSGFQL